MLRQKKNIELFLGLFFKKQIRQGVVVFLFRQKTDAGIYFFRNL